MKSWENYGNVIIMNTLFGMKNHTNKFQIIFLQILKNGKVINFIGSDNIFKNYCFFSSKSPSYKESTVYSTVIPRAPLKQEWQAESKVLPTQ